MADHHKFLRYKTDEEGNYVDENGNLIPDGEDPLPLSVNLLNYQGSDVQELVEMK